MEQYKLSIWFQLQIGFLIRYKSKEAIIINIPFIVIFIYIGLDKSRSGYQIFGKDLMNKKGDYIK